eukprot:m51a1_g10472 putative methyltransferase type 12 domain-containing protein (290) ;mRNA; r:77632-78755
MLRPKIEHTGIDWQKYAFGRGKYHRKTIGFGKYDKRDRFFSRGEIFIRELSIVDAGIGCAVWDAAIIFSRWIFKNNEIFRGRNVIELGAGCGVTGICAAHYADKVYLTDYIPQLLDNLDYNISLNKDRRSWIGEDDWALRGDEYAQFCNVDVSQHAVVSYLNWDEAGAAPGAEPVKPDDSVAQWAHTKVPKCELIIGSELTYSTLSIATLARVIDALLAPGGVFYEVLSDDRDGVPQFIELVKGMGFTVEIHEPPADILGNYGTHQRPETYHFYSFRRASEQCPFPPMM